MNKKFDDWLQNQLGPKTAAPTYPAPGRTVEEARTEIAKAVAGFLRTAEAWWPAHLQEVAARKEREERYQARLQEAIAEADRKRTKVVIAPEPEPEIKITPWPVKGICTPTGSSKTQIAAEVIAADRRARKEAGDTGPMATYPWHHCIA
jgi:hypothetical protein